MQQFKSIGESAIFDVQAAKFKETLKPRLDEYYKSSNFKKLNSRQVFYFSLIDSLQQAIDHVHVEAKHYYQQYTVIFNRLGSMKMLTDVQSYASLRAILSKQLPGMNIFRSTAAAIDLLAKQLQSYYVYFYLATRDVLRINDIYVILVVELNMVGTAKASDLFGWKYVYYDVTHMEKYREGFLYTLSNIYDVLDLDFTLQRMKESNIEFNYQKCAQSNYYRLISRARYLTFYDIYDNVQQRQNINLPTVDMFRIMVLTVHVVENHTKPQVGFTKLLNAQSMIGVQKATGQLKQQFWSTQSYQERVDQDLNTKLLKYGSIQSLLLHHQKNRKTVILKLAMALHRSKDVKLLEHVQQFIEEGLEKKPLLYNRTRNKAVEYQKLKPQELRVAEQIFFVREVTTMMSPSYLTFMRNHGLFNRKFQGTIDFERYKQVAQTSTQVFIERYPYFGLFTTVAIQGPPASKAYDPGKNIPNILNAEESALAKKRFSNITSPVDIKFQKPTHNDVVTVPLLLKFVQLGIRSYLGTQEGEVLLPSEAINAIKERVEPEQKQSNNSQVIQAIDLIRDNYMPNDNNSLEALIKMLREKYRGLSTEGNIVVERLLGLLNQLEAPAVQYTEYDKSLIRNYQQFITVRDGYQFDTDFVGKAVNICKQTQWSFRNIDKDHLEIVLNQLNAYQDVLRSQLVRLPEQSLSLSVQGSRYFQFAFISLSIIQRLQNRIKNRNMLTDQEEMVNKIRAFKLKQSQDAGKAHEMLVKARKYEVYNRILSESKQQDESFRKERLTSRKAPQFALRTAAKSVVADANETKSIVVSVQSQVDFLINDFRLQNIIQKGIFTGIDRTMTIAGYVGLLNDKQAQAKSNRRQVPKNAPSISNDNIVKMMRIFNYLEDVTTRYVRIKKNHLNLERLSLTLRFKNELNDPNLLKPILKEVRNAIQAVSSVFERVLKQLSYVILLIPSYMLLGIPAVEKRKAPELGMKGFMKTINQLQNYTKLTFSPNTIASNLIALCLVFETQNNNSLQVATIIDQFLKYQFQTQRQMRIQSYRSQLTSNISLLKHQEQLLAESRLVLVSQLNGIDSTLLKHKQMSDLQFQKFRKIRQFQQFKVHVKQKSLQSESINQLLLLSGQEWTMQWDRFLKNVKMFQDVREKMLKNIQANDAKRKDIQDIVQMSNKQINQLANSSTGSINTVAINITTDRQKIYTAIKQRFNSNKVIMLILNSIQYAKYDDSIEKLIQAELNTLTKHVDQKKCYVQAMLDQFKQFANVKRMSLDYASKNLDPTQFERYKSIEFIYQREALQLMKDTINRVRNCKKTKFKTPVKGDFTTQQINSFIRIAGQISELSSTQKAFLKAL